MKTSRSIAEQDERKQARGEAFSAHVSAPVKQPKSDYEARVARIRPYQWKPGKSANPGGKPKVNLAGQLARAIFEGNQEAIYAAFLKVLMKGNAYAFSVLADRGYGKLKETHRVETSPFADLTDAQLDEKIAELEEKLGVRRSSAGPILMSVNPSSKIK